MSTTSGFFRRLGYAWSPPNDLSSASAAPGRLPRRCWTAENAGPRAAVPDDLALLEHEGVVGDLEGLPRVLLDQEDGRPALVDRPDDPEELLDQKGCQPEGRLVEQQELRPAHQRPAHREHRLLATRHRGRLLPPALGEPREEPVHVLATRGDVGRRPLDEGAHPEVLLDGHLREDAAPLGHDPDAELHDLVGTEPVDARSREPHDAPDRPDDAEDGPDQRSLAASVRPEETGDPPRLDRERHVSEPRDRAAAGRDAVELKHAPSRSRGTPRAPPRVARPRRSSPRRSSGRS